MEPFKINLYPSSTSLELEASRARVLAETRAFVGNYASNGSLLVPEDELIQLKGYVRNGQIWNALELVDGRAGGERVKTAQRQDWSTRQIGASGLQQLLDICVNTAMLIPKETNFPGSQIGHTILYAQFCEHQDSRFRSAVEEPFRKQLLNGRFWEQLHAMDQGRGGYGYRIVNDTLANHFDVLDTDFAPKGMAIFERIAGEYPEFDLTYLPVKVIPRYREFIKKIHARREELSLSEDTLGSLVAPYIEALFELDTRDFSTLRFPAESAEGFIAQFNEPMIQYYLARSSRVREKLAEALDERMYSGEEVQGVVDKALCMTPDTREMVDLLVKNLDSSVEPTLNWINVLRLDSPELEAALSDSAREKLFRAKVLREQEDKKRRRRRAR